MDGLRPAPLFFFGERGNVAPILKRQHQADRKTRRLCRRECSPRGASGFGSSHSSTFEPADSDSEGRRTPNRPIKAPDRQRRVSSGRGPGPPPRPLRKFPRAGRTNAPDAPARSFRAGPRIEAANAPPVLFVQLPCPAVAIGAGDALSIATFSSRVGRRSPSNIFASAPSPGRQFLI